MLKRRALYAAVIIMAAGLAFWSGSPFLAAMTALLVLLPLLLFWLLRRDMGAVTMSLQVPASCPVGKPCPITVYITCPRRPWVMGLITLRIRWHNGMFDDVVEQERRLYLSDGVIQFQVSITSDLCGAAEVSCLSAVGTDILGLCAGSIPCPKPSSVIVVPTPLSLRLVPAENRLGRMDNELEFFNRRGPEFSEIFDLHPYAPGDDVRSIHWKLSGKLNELIVRQGSEPAHNYTAVILDAGLAQDEQTVPPQLVVGAVRLAAAVSSRLARDGVPTKTSFPPGAACGPTTCAARRRAPTRCCNGCPSPCPSRRAPVSAAFWLPTPSGSLPGSSISPPAPWYPRWTPWPPGEASPPCVCPTATGRG